MYQNFKIFDAIGFYKFPKVIILGVPLKYPFLTTNVCC